MKRQYMRTMHVVDTKPSEYEKGYIIQDGKAKRRERRSKLKGNRKDC